MRKTRKKFEQKQLDTYSDSDDEPIERFRQNNQVTDKEKQGGTQTSLFQNAMQQ